MGMAVREPVGSDSGGLETPHDVVRDVSAPGIEVGGRLVLEGDYLGVHCPPPSAVSAAFAGARSRTPVTHGQTAS